MPLWYCRCEVCWLVSLSPETSNWTPQRVWYSDISHEVPNPCQGLRTLEDLILWISFPLIQLAASLCVISCCCHTNLLTKLIKTHRYNTPRDELFARPEILKTRANVNAIEEAGRRRAPAALAEAHRLFSRLQAEQKKAVALNGMRLARNERRAARRAAAAARTAQARQVGTHKD